MKKIEAYEWNEAKRNSNLSLHGVDFTEITGFNWNNALTIDQYRDNEIRYLSYAPVKDRLYALVWTKRDSNIRLISFRKANKREVLFYEKTHTPNKR